MSTLAYIVVATTAGGLLSVLMAAGITLSVLSWLVKHLVSVSVGVLLGTAMLQVLPEAFESKAEPQALFATLLGGLFFFFFSIALRESWATHLQTTLKLIEM